MRRLRTILLIIAAILMTGCMRRPFSELRTEINLKLRINMTIRHDIDIPVPEKVRVALCDRETGKVVYNDFVGPKGGYIYPEPGTYDAIIYNINTFSTVVKNENNLNLLEATTDDIPGHVKSQLSKFLSARQKAKEKAAEEARKKLEAANQTRNGETAKGDSDTKAPVERIVNEPDHLFVGRKDDLQIPVLEAGESMEIVIEMDAETIVEVWNVKFENVKGAEYIRSVSALMTGMAESKMMKDREMTKNPVTIYFEMGKGEDGKSLVGKFHTFGKLPSEKNELQIDLNVTDTGGNEHYFQFDVTDQFDENEGHLIIVDKEINIPKPPSGGGGFSPEVDDWEDVNTDIII